MNTSATYGKLIRINMHEYLYAQGCGGKQQIDGTLADAENATVFHASLQYYLDNPPSSIVVASIDFDQCDDGTIICYCEIEMLTETWRCSGESRIKIMPFAKGVKYPC